MSQATANFKRAVRECGCWTPNGCWLRRFVRRIADWFYAWQIHKWARVRCRRCNKTKVVLVGTNEYFLLLNDIVENGVVVSPWSWAAVNKQRRGRMTTEYLCRLCREIEIEES